MRGFCPFQIAKSPSFPGASPPTPTRGPKAGPWTPPVFRSARFARYAGRYQLICHGRFKVPVRPCKEKILTMKNGKRNKRKVKMKKWFFNDDSLCPARGYSPRVQSNLPIIFYQFCHLKLFQIM